MSVWKWMGKLCSLTPWTRKWSLKLFYGWKAQNYHRRYGKQFSIQPHTVIFEAYMGKKYACSPKALYEAMLADPFYASWEKVWAFRNPERYSFLENNPNTRVVAYRKADYYEAYAKAKYWVTNSRLPRELEPKKEQEYIQCWHGTPLKKLGYDLEQYAEKEGTLQEVQDNYFQETRRVTHMPSPSPFYSEKIASAFRLRESGKEEVIWEQGYPRNDRLYTAKKEEVERIRQKLGIAPEKKVILYAPTWREDQHVPGEGYHFQLPVDFHHWKKVLGEEYMVLFRAHYFISNRFDFSGLEDFVKDVSELDDVNELYLAADVLVTDYSSVFFDYAGLERPILFYMYDYQRYKEELRDFYFDVSELPGPVCRTEEDLLENMRHLSQMEEAYREVYAQFNRRFNPHREACSEVYLRAWIR